jgi:serine/threonine protein phosphatase PrpC
MGASASRRRDDIQATKAGPGRSSAASESRISRLGLPVNPRPPTSRASFASHGLTHIGGKRENQDEVLVDDRFMGDPDMKLYCVFDGHGQHGAAAARFARDFLPTQLAFELEKSAAASRASRLTADAARLDSDERPPRMFGERQFGAIALASLVEVDPEIISQSLVRAFTVTDAEMRYEPWECALSGTTAIVALVIRGVMYVAHAGDSRAIVVFDALDDDSAPRLLERIGRFFKPRVARRDASANGDGQGEVGATSPFQKRLEAEQLTFDHRPGDERARLETAGGRVTAPWGGTRGDAKVGPERLFLKDAQLPGILISRSLGDEVASSVGCFAVPEVTRREVRKGDRALILASDGVWDAVDNEEVALAMERAAAEMREASQSEESPQRPAKIVAKTTRDEALAGWARRGGVADNVGVVAVLLDVE